MTPTPAPEPPRGPRPGVLVTGATGGVGSAVVRHLLGRGEPVVSAVRDPGEAGVVPGSEARPFDFENDETWGDALAGCDRLFLLRPPPIADVHRHLLPFADAALERGIRHIVFLSLQGVQFNRATPHHAVEKHLRARRAPFTFLRPNFFMQNLSTTYRADIRDRDQIAVPAGRARTAVIDTDDIGRVAARVLTEPGHTGKAYTLSGEQSLTYDDIARMLSAELSRPIRYTRPTAAEYAEQLRRAGAAPDYIAVQTMIWRIVRLNVSALPNRQVRRLTGAPATTFAEFAHRELGVWMPGA
ncbi:SDR family oxidoreductase [Microcella daejeonensis]|uniref:SDR family oxidoreductase n=1 Tax=Microcella daejeonensis TaxID=2994971 RepID=UPI002271A0B3|nr:SDR family oxidoreductase [Microcella daejeonensis]WAB84704.1 SDR family oxidoreductase [Microcella daejeonensis]